MSKKYKCCRCIWTGTDDEKEEINSCRFPGINAWDLVCPSCGCADFYMVSKMKPLFIPLRNEYFKAFQSGNKTDELRKYGPRWNEGTCIVGRGVTLSNGYGKNGRMKGCVWRFKKQRGSLFRRIYKEEIQAVFGTLNIDIACISITGIQPA